MSIVSLPTDILSNVLALVPAQQASRMRLVCKQLNTTISQDSPRTNSIWERLCYTAGFRQLTPEELKAEHTYRRHFVRSVELIPDLPYFHPVRKPVHGRVPRHISVEVLKDQAFDNALEVALFKIILREAPKARPKKKSRLEADDSPMKLYVKAIVATTATHAAFTNHTRFLLLFLQKRRFEKHLIPSSRQSLFHYIPTSVGHLELVQNCLSIDHLAKKIPSIDLCEALFFAAARGREDIVRSFLETNRSSVESILKPEGDLLHRLFAVPVEDFDSIKRMLAPVVARRFDFLMEHDYSRLDIYEILLADPMLNRYVTGALHVICLTRSIRQGHQGCLTLILDDPFINSGMLYIGLDCAIHNKRVSFAEQILEKRTLLRQLSQANLLTLFNLAKKNHLPDIAARIRSLLSPDE